ncbi:uncharacterized protein V6R79_009988 [Siganus canaliculatus]
MAKDMTLLWGSGSPPCWRVMICLEEKNLQGYNQKLLSMEKKEHKSKEVLDITPRGQVPAFKHGNVLLGESIAIGIYLENKFKSQGTKLIPDSAEDQALMYQRIMESTALSQKTSYVLYHNMLPEEERHDSALKRNKNNLAEEISWWQGYIEKSPSGFIAGKSFTLADAVIFPGIAYLFRCGLSEQRYPKLAAYYNKLKDRPSVKATWPPHWLTSPPRDTLKDV